MNNKKLFKMIDTNMVICNKCGTKNKGYATITRKNKLGHIVYYNGYWCKNCGKESFK